MVGVSFKYVGGYKGLMRGQYYELLKAFPEVKAFERDVPEIEGREHNGVEVIPIHNAEDLPDGVKVVVLSGQDGKHIKGETSLEDFEHPEDVVYYFGDDLSNLTTQKIGNVKYETVYIPHMDKSLFSCQAMAIVLYNRRLRNGNS